MASKNDKKQQADSVEQTLTKVSNAYFALCRRLASALNRKKSGR